jgi:flagellar protein FliS
MNIHQSYREAAIQGANPVALVVRLYEQMIEDLRQAAIAIEQNDIERRSNRIKHALLVIAHLQSTLDFAQGGKVAQDLEKFYSALRQSVVAVQCRPTKRGVTQLITDLLAVREAWIQVEKNEYPTVASAAVAPSPAPPESDGAFMNQTPRMDWNG